MNNLEEKDQCFSSKCAVQVRTPLKKSSNLNTKGEGGDVSLTPVEVSNPAGPLPPVP